MRVQSIYLVLGELTTENVFFSVTRYQRHRVAILFKRGRGMENEFNLFASFVIFDHGYCADVVVGRLFVVKLKLFVDHRACR